MQGVHVQGESVAQESCRWRRKQPVGAREVAQTALSTGRCDWFLALDPGSTTRWKLRTQRTLRLSVRPAPPPV